MLLQYNRKISAGLTARLSKTRMHPNHVTMMALVFGMIAGVCFAGGSRLWMLFGALALHVSFILDNCDGELARLKSLQTEFGKRLDVTADLMVDFALWLGLGLGAYRMLEDLPLLLMTCLACAGSLVNFAMVIQEKLKGVSTSIHNDAPSGVRRKPGVLSGVLDFISHNGDVITFVWILAIFASPGFFLLLGCVYMNALWITRYIINLKVAS